MVTREEIFQKLQGLNKKEITCQVATVKSIDTKKKTCTVILQDGLELPDVRLKAAVDLKESEEYYYVIPRPKSTVLIALVGGEPTAGEYYVIAVNEIDSLQLKIDKTELFVAKNKIVAQVNKRNLTITDSEISLKDSNNTASVAEIRIADGTVKIKTGFLGIKLENDFGSLKDALFDLTQKISMLQIVTSTGVGTVSPASLAQLQAVGAKISQILN